MASATPKLGLIKPNISEKYDLDVWNGNLDKIDALQTTKTDQADFLQVTTFKNLYNPALAVNGKLIEYVDGSVVNYATGAISGMIPVEAGKVYTLSLPNTEAGIDPTFRCYGANLAFIGNSKSISTHPVAYGAVTVSQVNVNGRKQVTLTMASDTLVRYVNTGIIYFYVAHTTEDFDRVRNSLQFEESPNATTFEAYKIIKIKGDRISGNVNILSGKKFACAGDSITLGTGYSSYGKVVSDRNSMAFYNYGIDGSTLANISGRNPFTGRWNTMNSELDYIVLWFGWNDGAYTTLGTITDVVNTTFYGAWNEILPGLINKYPLAKIGIVVPYMNNATFRQAVRDIGIKFGIPTLDLYDKKTPMIWLRDDADSTIAQFRRTTFTYDGTHPNQNGHNYISTFLEDFIRSL